jgi:hypothetical protein
MQQQLQPQFLSDNGMTEKLLHKRGTLVLSDATITGKNDLLDMLHLPEKEAFWRNKPTGLSQVNGFPCRSSAEDSIENRRACLTYLAQMLNIPSTHGLEDVQSNRTLLTVDFLGIRKISGTTDVAILESVNITNYCIRNNIETLFELKKPANLQRQDNTPQAVGEHFAASYLNMDHPVVSVLTDLNLSWTFYWFARSEDDSRVALYNLYLEGDEAATEAQYILDSL